VLEEVHNVAPEDEEHLALDAIDLAGPRGLEECWPGGAFLTHLRCGTPFRRYTRNVLGTGR